MAKAYDLKIKITFTDEVLGTYSNNPEIQREYISSKAPDAKTREEEIAAIGVEKAIEKSMTVFPKMEDGTPFMWGYQIKGFFKEACSALNKVVGTLSSKLKAFKKEVDNRIFVYPKQIPIKLSGEMGNCQRPIRTSGPQGENTSLANSETIPAGSSIEFHVICFTKDDVGYVKEWLKYGHFKGFLQWRNSGKGTFEHEILEEVEKEADW